MSGSQKELDKVIENQVKFRNLDFKMNFLIALLFVFIALFVQLALQVTSVDTKLSQFKIRVIRVEGKFNALAKDAESMVDILTEIRDKK